MVVHNVGNKALLRWLQIPVGQGSYSQTIPNPFPNNKFWTLPNMKSFQTTIFLVKKVESSPKG